jgi:predicted PurR-regulated permease PerM
MSVPELSPWVTTVAIANGVIALLGFCLAWQIWQVRNTLSDVADTVLDWERNTHGVLDPTLTPSTIRLGQQGAANLRQQYAQLQRQLQNIQRILGVLGLVGQLWRRWPTRKGPRSPRRRSALAASPRRRQRPAKIGERV